MPDSEHFKHIEQQPPLREAEETQRSLELAGEWDDDKRREAVRQNRLESDAEPLSYEDSLSFFQEYEKDFTDAGLDAAEDSEERGKWQKIAEDMRLDVKLAKVGSEPPLRRLIHEVENHLESLAHMKGEDPDSAAIHESDIQDLRRVRDSLFTEYEQIPPSEIRESASSVIGKITGRPTPHLENGVKHREGTAEEESGNEKPRLGEVLDWIDQTLGSNETTTRFREMFGEISAMSPGSASRMAEELFSIYEDYTLGEGSIQDYKQKINNLFENYQEETFDSQQAA
jgi:hypothetical protein